MEQQTQTTNPMKRVEQGVDFTTVKPPIESYANAIFIDCNFQGMDLSFKDFSDSTLINCNLSHADMSFCHSRCTVYRHSDLTQTNLFGASMYRAVFTYSEFLPSNVQSIDLRAAKLPGNTYVLDRVLPDGSALTALLTPDTLQINAELATHAAWEETLSEHPSMDFQVEVHSILVMCRALRAEHRGVPFNTVKLEEAA